MKIYLLLSFVIMGFHSMAQDRIDSAMSALSEKYTQEKIYLAYNKKDYIAGETIWFKGFVFSGYQLSAISSNLYVELYNSKHSIIAQQMIPIIKGVAEGSLALPDTISENIYFVRAYTKWMLNFSEDFQYIHQVRVNNRLSKLKLQAINHPWDAVAFVEGGNLLSNQPSNIAIRLLAGAELPESWNGYIYDSTNPSQKIVSFHSIDRNVAVCSLTPQEGRSYKAFIQDNIGRERTISLPSVQATGIAFAVNQEDTLLQYRIHFNKIPIGEIYKLIGTIDNDIVYRANIKNTDSNFLHSFSTAKMVKGVLRLTLFDKNYKVAAERLCFLSPEVKIKPFIDSLFLNSKARAANEITFGADSGKNYCFFVLDENADNPFTENNILSSFWLTADFQDKMNGAENYFPCNDTKNKKTLDAVLMTETWKRFEWQEVLNGKFPVIKFPADNYLSYSATAIYKNKILANETVTLLVFLPDSSRQFLEAKTDAEGKFVVEGLAFTGDAKISYRGVSKKLSQEAVHIKFAPLNIFAKYEKALPEANYLLLPKNSADTISNEAVRSVENLENEHLVKPDVHVLKEVVVKTRIPSPTELLDEKLSSGRFYNPREMIYDFINKKQGGTSGSDLLYWLEGRVPGDQTKTTYYINEFSASPGDVKMTSMEDVAMIKIQGKRDTHQVFIYLKTGAEMLNSGKALNSTIIQGYKWQERFVSPDYTKPDFKRWKSDTRDMLFWDNVYSADSANQKFSIKFYNNDRAKKFRLIVMAVSEEEAPIYFEKLLQ